MSISVDAAFALGQKLQVSSDKRRKSMVFSCRCMRRIISHCLLFINLSTDEAEKKQKNIGYVLESCRAARDMGADRIVVHTGGVGDMSLIWALGLKMTYLVLFGDLCGSLNNAFVHMTGQNVGNDIREDAFRRLMTFSFS